MNLERLVAKNVKKIRMEQRISQVDLSEKTGIARQFLNKIENEEKNLTLSTIQKLAQGLKVEPFMLLCSEPSPSSQNAKQLQEHIDKLEECSQFLRSMLI